MESQCRSILLLVISSISLCAVNSVPLETSIKKCPRGDFACGKKVAQVMLPLFAEGAPDLGIPPLDPLYLKQASINGANFKFSTSEFQLHGYKNAKVEEFKLDLDDSKTFVIDLNGKFDMHSKYAMTGKILVLPINGHGDFNFSSNSFGTKLVCPITTVKKDAKEFVEIAGDCDVSFSFKDFKFMVTNLIDGNPELSEAALKAMNDNWEGVISEMAPYFKSIYAEAMSRRLKPFFAAFSIDQLLE